MSNNNLPHVQFLSLKNDGVVQEIIVLKEDSFNGDIYFIAVKDLDAIDRQRMIKVLTKRDAPTLPLYDLLAHETLGNGMNALEYFHQLVKIRTQSGDVFPVGSGMRGEVKAKAVTKKTTTSK